MTRFSSPSAAAAGIILVISPLVGCLCIDFSTFLSLRFLCGLILGIPVALRCCAVLGSRLWILLDAALCFCGIFFYLYWKTGIFATIGIVLAGFGCSGLFLILPANLIIRAFPLEKILAGGILCTVVFALGLLWKTLMERTACISLALAVLSIICGSFFCIMQPSESTVLSHSEIRFIDTPRTCRIRFRSICKVFSYLWILSFAYSFALFLSNYTPDLPVRTMGALAASAEAVSLFLVPGMLAGPLFCALFIRQKGIYGCSVLLIFLAETAIMCFGFAQENFWMDSFGFFALGLGFSMLPVFLPVLCHYLYGPAECSERLALIFSALPCGFALIPLLARGKVLNPLNVNYLVITAMILLIISFFSIFSAWKHRFILLKRPHI